GSPLHKSTQQVRTQGPIRHADCRQRKLADFLCTGGIIQGLISAAHEAIFHLFLPQDGLLPQTTAILVRVKFTCRIGR
ncbi:hypothetical protein F6Y01_22125, partial [Escherichia coli]